MTKRRRRRRNEQNYDGAERWQPSLLHLLVAAILLSLVAALLLRSNTGQRLGLPGAYVWATALLIAFSLRLVHLARFVLPPEAEHAGARGWQEGLRMLIYYVSVRTLPESLRQGIDRSDVTVPSGLPDSFAEFQAGLVDSHQALALGKGTGFSRAAGPGYVRLEDGERISHLVDLRRQTQQRDVDALTRDGIEIQATLSLTFRVRRTESDAQEWIPFPYDKDSIFLLTYANGVGATSEIPWNERICDQAASLFITEVARYRLDQLYQPEEAAADAVPVQELVLKVRQRLEERMTTIFDCDDPETCPVELLNVSAIRFKPPQEVIEQRIENWQSAWERLAARREARSHEDREDRSQDAHSRRLADLMERITHDAERLCDGDRQALSDLIVHRVRQLAHEMKHIQDGQGQRPGHVVEALDEACTWLDELPTTGEER